MDRGSLGFSARAVQLYGIYHAGQSSILTRAASSTIIQFG
jgi:hypothetical protein